MKASVMKAAALSVALTALSFGQAVQKVDAHSGTLLALERMWNQAQLTRDVAAIQNLVAERFINTEWDGSVSNREQFLADIRDPQFQPSVMSNDSMRVDLYGDTAVVTGRYHVKGTFQGKPYDHIGRFTDTWILIDGTWRCVASHTSLLKQ